MRYINRQHNSAIFVGVTPPLNNGYIHDHSHSCPKELGNAEPISLALIKCERLFLAYPTYSYGGPRYKAPRAGYEERPKGRTSHGTTRDAHRKS